MVLIKLSVNERDGVATAVDRSSIHFLGTGLFYDAMAEVLKT